MKKIHVILLSSRILSTNVKIKIHKTIILPIELYGYETWSLTLREECRLKEFDNKILRKIFGPILLISYFVGSEGRFAMWNLIVCIVHLK